MKNKVILTLTALCFIAATQQGFLWKSKAKEAAPEQKVMIGHGEAFQTEIQEPSADKKISPSSLVAPDFTLPNHNGESISLSQFKGSIVVLEWTNHECPYVKKHYDSINMQRLQMEYRKKGVIWLSIISSAEGKQGHVTGEEAIQIATGKRARPTQILIDESGEVGRLYKAKTTPHMFVINENGGILYQGAIDSNSSASQSVIPDSTNYVSAALDAALAGETVETSQTKPYGCSIKY